MSKINPKKIRTLLIYQAYREGIKEFYESHIFRLRETGYNVEGFCISLYPPCQGIMFPELDRLWKSKNPDLLKLYEKLKQKSKDFDVILLYNGGNLHPNFLKELKTFNAYMCFDDPESSDILSRPVAKFFDACFVGNIASQNQYLSWECKNVFFRPMGYFESHLYSTKINESEIKSRKNNIDISLFCEIVSPWRRERAKKLKKAFPRLYARGNGWSRGAVPESEMLKIITKTKIGFNMHNSTGPINLRTYVLPANGIMQICDNKYFLGQMFELGKEVVGYCEIEEAIELINYYLKHDEERKKIAIAGWRRATRDYNEYAVWQKQMEQISNLIS